jgi:hypothetical protein
MGKVKIIIAKKSEGEINLGTELGLEGRMLLKSFFFF